MDRKLLQLILDYQMKVGEAVAMLEKAGIQRPPSNMAWATSEKPGSGTLPGGFTYYAHGFGCAVDGPEWGVDFDFGDAGQIDGFDAFRLCDFARKTMTKYGFESEKGVEDAIRVALEKGELRFSGYILYYLSNAV